MRECKKCFIVKRDRKFVPLYSGLFYTQRGWLCKDCAKMNSEDIKFKEAKEISDKYLYRYL